MEIQLNKDGFMTDVPVNSWMPFLQMMNMLRLGRSFGAIVDEIQAGHGNLCRASIRRWRTIYQKALGSALDHMNLRTVGGKDQTVVLDEAVVGVHAEDGWTGGSRGINKAGAEETFINSVGVYKQCWCL